MLAPHRFTVATGVSCPRRIMLLWIVSLTTLLAVALNPSRAFAVNGTWFDTTSGGLWSNSVNWSSGAVANGTDGIADFSTLDITADDTVHLDTARTIGNLKFGDATPSNNWILDNSGNAADILTLAASGGNTPTITVNNDTATISAVLAGTQGLAKSGAGTLLLSGNNTFSGTVALSAGTLVLGNANALGSTAGGTTVISGATLDLGGQTIGAEALAVAGAGFGGNGALINSSASAASYSGTINSSAAGSFTVGGAGDITLSGGINGGLNTVTKIGNNTLTLSGTADNPFLPVTVSAGTVVLAKTSTATVHAIGGFGALGLLVSGGTAQLGGTGGDQISDGAGVLVTSGAFDTNGLSETVGTLNLQGIGTGVSGNGALVNSASAASVLTPSSTTLTANATIGVTQSAGSLTLNNVISGNFALTKVGPGTLALTGNNSFSGGLTVQNGTLQVAMINNLGSSGPLGLNTSVTLGSGSFGQTGTIEYTGGTASSTMPFTVADFSGFQIDSAAANLTLSGTIGGSSVLTKTGLGTLTLSGNNTFIGFVDINAGTVQVGGTGALNSTTPNGVGFGGSAGILSLAGNSVAIFSLSESGSPNNAIVVQNGSATPATLTINLTTPNSSAYGGVLQDGGAGALTLIMTGGGSQQLFGNNTFSGGLTVQNGSLQIPTINNASTTGALGNNTSVTLGSSGQTGTLEYSGATAASNMPFTLAAGGSGAFQVDTAATNLTLSGAVSGSGALTKSGAGTLTLSGNNTFTGGVSINAGTLQVGGAGALNSTTPDGVAFGPASTGVLSLAGNSVSLSGLATNATVGTPAVSGDAATNNVVTLTVNNPGSNTFAGVLQDGSNGGSLALVKGGGGTLTLGGNNTFTGGVTINAGMLQLGSTGALNMAGTNAVMFGSGSTGTLSLGGNSVTINGITTSATIGTPVVQNGSATPATLTVNIASGISKFAGVLQDSTGGGALSLTKNGAGTLTLSGNNTYTGVTTVNAGALVLGNSNALGSTAAGTVVASGATLDLASLFPVTSTAEPLTITGTGVGGNGALINSGYNYGFLAGTVNASGPFSVGGSGGISLSGSVNCGNNVFTLTKIGSDALYLSGSTDNFNLAVAVNSGFVVLAKTSSHTPNDVHAIGQPGLTVNGGTAQLSGTGGDQIYDFGNVAVTSGAFDTNGQSEQFLFFYAQGTGIGGTGALVNSASAASTIRVNSLTLTGDTTIGVIQSDGSLTLNEGAILGNFVLTKVGPGTLTLIGQNSSTCPINVNAGTLIQSGGTLTASVNNSANFVFTSGTFSGPAVTNSGTFTYNGGTFNGRLINAGIAIFNADFTAGNGIENDANLSIPSGRTISLNGQGLDNEGTLTMAGGTLNLSTSGNAANVNRGNFNLSASVPFNLNGATLTNNGTLSLNGGLMSGPTGALLNGAGGTISGTGTITSPFNNGGGLVAVTGGTLNITQAFTNSGAIQLSAVTASLTGGAITNSGTINGFGNLGNAVTNAGNGTVEAVGGILYLSGTLANQAGGMIRTGSGNKLLVVSGLPTNAGIINLTGGTFDINGHALNNTGQITGFGTFATGGSGLDNNGSITFTGGTTTVNGPVTNENGKTITITYNPAIFTGLVTNTGTGTFNIISTTATFAGGSSGTFNGTFTNNPAAAFTKAGSGALEIDGPPTLNNSSSLAVNDTGALRFHATVGSATVGTGVSATVNNAATLELAGSVSALSSGPNRVKIVNNSSAAAGILVSGTHQQVGNIDGAGATQVNAGSDLTANHIIQSALVIGSTAGSPGLVTIDASDASGNPLVQSAVGPSGMVLSLSVAPSGPFGGGMFSPSGLDPLSAEGFSGDPIPAGLLVGGAIVSADAAAVPEPSTLLLALLCLAGLIRPPQCGSPAPGAGVSVVITFRLTHSSCAE